MGDLGAAARERERGQAGVAEQHQHPRALAAGLQAVDQPGPVGGLLGEDADVAERAAGAVEAQPERLVAHLPAIGHRSVEGPLAVAALGRDLEAPVGLAPAVGRQPAAPERARLRAVERRRPRSARACARCRSRAGRSPASRSAAGGRARRRRRSPGRRTSPARARPGPRARLARAARTRSDPGALSRAPWPTPTAPRRRSGPRPPRRRARRSAPRPPPRRTRPSGRRCPRRSPSRPTRTRRSAGRAWRRRPRRRARPRRRSTGWPLSRPASIARLRSASSFRFATPDPAGISLPMITFSFRPSRWSTLPLIAASVSTRVVSWKEAAARKLSVFSEALVTPSSTGAPSPARRPRPAPWR